MKKILFLLILIPIAGVSQNKKEQIATLNFKLDSLNNKISNERQESKKEIEENEKKISSQKAQLIKLNNKVDKLNESLELEKANLNTQKLKNIEFEKLNNKYEQQVESLELKIDSMSKSYKIINMQVLKHFDYEGIYYDDGGGSSKRCIIYGDSVDYCEGRIREDWEGKDYWECWPGSEMYYQMQDETGILKLIGDSEGEVMEAESYNLKFEFEIIDGKMTFLFGDMVEEGRFFKVDSVDDWF